MAKKRPKPKTTKSSSSRSSRKVADNASKNKADSGQSEYLPALVERLEVVAARVGSKYAVDKLLGVARGTFGAYCRPPFRMPGAEVLARLARATGCSAEWLLLGVGLPFPEKRIEELSQLHRLLLDAADKIEEAMDAARASRRAR